MICIIKHVMFGYVWNLGLAIKLYSCSMLFSIDHHLQMACASTIRNRKRHPSSAVYVKTGLQSTIHHKCLVPFAFFLLTCFIRIVGWDKPWQDLWEKNMSPKRYSSLRIKWWVFIWNPGFWRPKRHYSMSVKCYEHQRRAGLSHGSWAVYPGRYAGSSCKWSHFWTIKYRHMSWFEAANSSSHNYLSQIVTIWNYLRPWSTCMRIFQTIRMTATCCLDSPASALLTTLSLPS